MTTGGGSSQWIKSNLAALGSAAVLTVYAAGYARTKEAADKFAEEANVRRPDGQAPRRVAIGDVVDAATSPRAESPRDSASLTASPATIAPSASDAPSAQHGRAAQPAGIASSAPALVVKPARTNSGASLPATRLDSAIAAAATPATTPAPTASTAAIPATPTSPAAPANVSAPVTTTTPVAPTLTTAAPDSAKAVEKPADKPVVLKDGVYSGWGSSRHGDIQAYVEVKAGRIVSAFISECLTQYSCSWIAKLPPQVAARQSADIDYVSGATQSSNAFYYAVVDALKKAK